MKRLTPTKNLEGINKPLDIQETEEGILVQTLRGGQSYRDFADYLNEKIPAGMPGMITFQSVWNWENGVHPITGECLMAWLMFYPKRDARYQLAMGVIHLRSLDAQGYSEENGKKLLKAVVK